MPEQAERPNVLMICCDHLRADNLGCNGHPVIQTPQIDKLAAQGVNFQRALSECPVCVPARRILMTGQNPYHIHMDRNKDTQPFPEGPKLAELITRAGYQTFASGKMHTCPQRNRIGFEDVMLNEEGRKQGGLLRDDYEIFLMENNAQHLAYTHGLGNNEYGLRLSPLPEPMTTTHWTADRAMHFIERRDPTRPFFLYVSFDKPHPPVTPTREYYDLYAQTDFPDPVMGDWTENKLTDRIRSLRFANQWEHFKDNREWIQQNLRGFGAMTTHIDSMIGVLLGTLREHGALGNTWVVFISDHGDQLFDHGNFAKGDFHQGSTRIPYIIVPPANWARENGLVTGRNDTSTPAGLADIMPTLLEACGIEIPDSVDGQSLLGRIRYPGEEFREISFGNCNSSFAASDGRFRYQWCGEHDYEYLFDQESDPRDEHDLADDPGYDGVKKALRTALIEWMAAHEDPHIDNGRLQAIPEERKLERGHAINNWNNRGRHGV
ncbi:MAG: sulfatase-like hydrolase/transferase [Oceanipulchritudo sp.]